MSQQLAAVVTGAGGGIGRACCGMLAGSGYHVIGFDRQFSSAEVPWTRVRGDVTSAADVERLYAEVADHYGRLDTLVTAAGVASYARDVAAGIDADEWTRCYRVNVLGVAAVIYGAVPLLAASGGGAIVTVASISARRSSEVTSPAYAASKGAVVALSRSFAASLATQGTRVNCVTPGTVETAMTADWPPDRIADIRASVPLRRLGTPEEIASAVGFLASDAASYLTGVTLDVNGGVFMTP